MISKQDLVEVLHHYIAPLYMILGGILAIVVIGAAVYIVLAPLIKRL